MYFNDSNNCNKFPNCVYYRTEKRCFCSTNDIFSDWTDAKLECVKNNAELLMASSKERFEFLSKHGNQFEGWVRENVAIFIYFKK